MARLWIALAVCLVVLIVLVDDSDARCGGGGLLGIVRGNNPPPPPPRPKPCASNPCRNRGVCSDDGNRWRCVCVNGFGGTSCEKDIEKPHITCPINMERNTIPGQSYGLLQYDLPKASDNVVFQLTVQCLPKPGSKLKRGTTKVTCVVFDAAGNTDHCSFDVVLKDNEKPSLPCPIDMTVLPTPGLSTGVLNYDITRAHDNVDSNLEVRCAPKPGTILGRQKTRVTCQTSDRSNNDASCSFFVTLIKAEETTNIKDKDKPRLICPTDMEVFAPGHSPVVLKYTIPGCSDRVTCDPKPGSMLTTCTTKVSCHTSDQCCSFYVRKKRT